MRASGQLPFVLAIVQRSYAASFRVSPSYQGVLIVSAATRQPQLEKLLGSRSLGIDYGVKNIGLALSAGFSQRPIGSIINTAGSSTNVTLTRPILDKILKVMVQEGAERIIIGNPYFRDGSISPQANLTKRFARLLANRALQRGLIRLSEQPLIYLWDERLTSQAARVNIKTKSSLYSSLDIDSQAAALVLEDFYAANGRGAEAIVPDAQVKASISKGTGPTRSRKLTGDLAISGAARAPGSESESRSGNRMKAAAEGRKDAGPTINRAGEESPLTQEIGTNTRRADGHEQQKD